MIYNLRVPKAIFCFIISTILLIIFTKNVLGLVITPAEELLDNTRQDTVLGVDVVTSDTDVLDLEVISMEAPEVNSEDPIRLLLDIKNKGDIALSLDRVELEIMDLSEELLDSVSDITLSKVDSSTTKKIQAEFDSSLTKGKYKIDASAIFMGERIFSKKMILKINDKPNKVKKGEKMIEVGQKVQAYVFGRRLGSIFILLGLIFLVLVLFYYFRKEKEIDTNFEKKLSNRLKKNKIAFWVIIGALTFMMAFGFYLILIFSKNVNTSFDKNTLLIL